MPKKPKPKREPLPPGHPAGLGSKILTGIGGFFVGALVAPAAHIYVSVTGPFRKDRDAELTNKVARGRDVAMVVAAAIIVPILIFVLGLSGMVVLAYASALVGASMGYGGARGAYLGATYGTGILNPKSMFKVLTANGPKQAQVVRELGLAGPNVPQVRLESVAPKSKPQSTPAAPEPAKPSGFKRVFGWIIRDKPAVPSKTQPTKLTKTSKKKQTPNGPSTGD